MRATAALSAALALGAVGRAAAQGADFSGLWLGTARAGVGAGGAWAFVGEDRRVLVNAPGGLWMALGAANSSADGNTCTAAAAGNASVAEFEYTVAWRQLNLELLEVAGGALPPAARHGPRPPAEAGRVGLVAWAPAGGGRGRDARRVPPPGNATAGAAAEAPVGCGAAAAPAPKGAAEALSAVAQLSAKDLAALPTYATPGAPPQPRGFFAAASGGRAAALVASAQGVAAASALGFPGDGDAAPVEAPPPEDLTVEFRNYLSHECVGFDGYRAVVVATLLDLNATRSAQEARCEVGRVDPKSGDWTYTASVWPAPCPEAADAPGAVEAVFLQALEYSPPGEACGAARPGAAPAATAPAPAPAPAGGAAAPGRAALAAAAAALLAALIA